MEEFIEVRKARVCRTKILYQLLWKNCMCITIELTNPGAKKR